MNQQLIALDLPDRLFQILSDTNYITVGDLINKIEQDEETLYEVEGLGPKSLELIKEKLEAARTSFEASNRAKINTEKI